MQQGEEIGLFTSSVMWGVWAEDEYFTHHTRRKSNFTSCCTSYFLYQRYIKSPFCLCKWGGLGDQAFEEKMFEKTFWNWKFSKKI